MLLVEGSISKCGKYHHRSNQGVTLESGSFSVEQFYESVCSVYEGARGCLLYEQLQSFIIAADVDFGGGGCSVSSAECAMQVAAMDN